MTTEYPDIENEEEEDDDDDDQPIVRPITRRTPAPLKIEKESPKKRGRPAGRPKKTAADSDEEPKKKVARSRKKNAGETAALPRPAARRAAEKKEAVSAAVDQEEEVCSNGKQLLKEGQKYLCPPTGDGTRAFYESLLKEKPNSLIANKYCIEHGVLIGTQFKQQLERHKQLRDLGAFKGTFGGTKNRFKNGISKEDMLLLESKYNNSPKISTKSTRRALKNE